jgi:hypothetical protein
MTRVLLIETASPKRICEKAQQILKSGLYPDPEVFVLCDERSSHHFRQLPGVTIYALPKPSRRLAIKALDGNTFDVVFAFWTGEKRFRWWKLLSFRLWIKETYILSGDTNEFRLTWKAICRHTVFRLKHPLPTDHYEYAVPEGDRERVLVIQSAEPFYVLSALERLRKKPLFTNPRFTLFCRNLPEIVNSFHANSTLQRVIVHSKAQNVWKHWRNLRNERFDAIILFLTGNPSYWKVKIFAFLLGTRRILIFNETSDCFFFNFHQWLALMTHRVRVRPHSAGTGSRWSHSARILISLMLKPIIFPFRFVWVLCVWFWLRSAGLRASRESRDYSL